MRSRARNHRWIIVVLAAWATPLWAQDKKEEEDPASQAPVAKVIRGRVVDEAAQPLAGITLSTHWYRQEDQPVRAAGDIVKTKAQDMPMGEALEALLLPLGLRVVVRDEVIVLEAVRPRPVDAALSR
jgi:hypothetical protein